MTSEWYFQVMGQELGPLTAAELRAKVSNGQIQRDTLIRKGIDGKWIFGGNVKGLFAVPEELPPPPPPPPPPPKPKPPVILPPASSVKPSLPATTPATFVTLAEKETDSQPPSVEFYNFVGFREAISPVLHDAVKQFAADRGLSISQLNRQALANFIQRPELASDLLITAIAALPQPVNSKSNQDGSCPLSDRDKVEIATFRFTLFNSSHDSIQVEEAAFLPESIEERSYDTIGTAQHPMLEHLGHIPVRLGPVVIGKAIRMTLDVSIPPEATRDIIVWFHDDLKPSLMKIRGQLVVGHGGNLAMSEFFTITLHGDSPSPNF